MNRIGEAIVNGASPAGYTAALYTALNTLVFCGSGHGRGRPDDDHRGRELPRLLGNLGRDNALMAQ